MLTERLGMFPAMSPDDPGVMGNLPRSRPKTNATEPAAASKPAAAKTSTSKRATASRPAKRTTSSGGTAKARSSRSSSPRTRARATQKPAEPATPQPQSQGEVRGSTDPVTGAVMLAGKVVEGGLKVAGGIIKRLPRP
jgi:hypothetical protein